MPSASYRLRQSITVGREVESASAIFLLDKPLAAASTIRLRNATRCSVLPERINRSNSALSSGVTASALLRAMHQYGAHPLHNVKHSVRRYTSWPTQKI